MSKLKVDVIVHAQDDDHQHRGAVLRKSQAEYEMLMSMGYVAPHVPVADFLKHYHELSGAWMVVSLMHWDASHRDAVVSREGDELGLSKEESLLLFSEFEAFVAEEGMRVCWHDATTWLLQAPHAPVVDNVPLFQLAGQSMKPALQALEATPFWLRFLTESQMFLSGHSDVVNGLWVWGGGALFAQHQRPLIVCGDEAWLNAARVVSTQVEHYDPEQSVQPHAVYFIPDVALLDMDKLKHQLRDHNVCWHWDNVTYTVRGRGWASRIWSRLRHAD